MPAWVTEGSLMQFNVNKRFSQWNPAGSLLSCHAGAPHEGRSCYWLQHLLALGRSKHKGTWPLPFQQILSDTQCMPESYWTVSLCNTGEGGGIAECVFYTPPSRFSAPIALHLYQCRFPPTLRQTYWFFVCVSFPKWRAHETIKTSAAWAIESLVSYKQWKVCVKSSKLQWNAIRKEWL